MNDATPADLSDNPGAIIDAGYAKLKETHAKFAIYAWIGSGIYLFFTTTGLSFFSWAALGFFIAGSFAASLIFGVTFYLINRGVAKLLVRFVGEPTVGIARALMIFSSVMFFVEIAAIYSAAQYTVGLIGDGQQRADLAYASDHTALNAAVAAFNEANEIEQKMMAGKTEPVSDPVAAAKMNVAIQKGLTEARNVRDEYLEYLDPALPQHFRNELVRGYELLLEGRAKSDVTTQMTAIQLLQSYYQEFLPSHVDGILNRMNSE